MDRTWRSHMVKRVRGDIKRCGQCVIYVGDGPRSFHYTVGRHARGLPELLLAAPLDPETGMRLLNTLDKTMLEPLPSDSKVDLGGRYPVIVIDATAASVKDQYTCIAGAYFGHDDYAVQQILMCDRKGRFPGEAGCDSRFAAQPILGPR